MNNNVLDNVKYILDKYSKHIRTDKQLLLLYWQQIDGVEMDKQAISTPDFLHKATNANDILSAKLMLDILEREGLY